MSLLPRPLKLSPTLVIKTRWVGIFTIDGRDQTPRILAGIVSLGSLRIASGALRRWRRFAELVRDGEEMILELEVARDFQERLNAHHARGYRAYVFKADTGVASTAAHHGSAHPLFLDETHAIGMRFPDGECIVVADDFEPFWLTAAEERSVRQQIEDRRLLKTIEK